MPETSEQCPGFAEGSGCTMDEVSLICTFSPAGLVPRPVRIWISDVARQQHGPLIIWWHGLGLSADSTPTSPYSIGPDVVADIVANGGIVAAPERSEKRQTVSITELPWLLALGTGEDDDLRVMDEIVACAQQQVGIDVRRIHSAGMSAGALQTGQAGPRRSGYLASTAVFSGGQFGAPPIQDPNNLYAVALFHGGPDDIVAINFMDLQLTYQTRLQEQGHFNMVCNHGEGHTLPSAAARAGWDFLQDHPYGVAPEPYADGLPPTMPDYCELAP
jgi:predicted esterase